MRNFKNPLLLILSLALLGQSIIALPAAAQEVIDQPATVHLSIIDAVKKAKLLLADELAKKNAAEKSPVVVNSKNVALKVTLAVWNQDTDNITLVSVLKNGDKMTVVSPTDVKVSVAYSNGINSQYDTPADSHSLVVGVIYPVFNDISTKKKKAYELHNKIYVPYESEFYSPDVLIAGSDYLSFLIKDAYDQLAAKKVKSKAFPDKMLVDALDPYLLKTIILVEHIDLAIFKDDAPEHAVGKLLISLGINGEDTFNSAVSVAGARGIVQFIPSTYNRLVKVRPEIGLNPDFNAGMDDHRNAIMAQIAYLDSVLAELPQVVRDDFVNDRSQSASFLAAAYNGGSLRVKRAFTYWGSDWAVSHAADMAKLQSRASVLKSAIALLKKKIAKLAVDKDIKAAKKEMANDQSERDQVIVKIAAMNKADLKNETVLYVEKTNKVYNMLSNGFFATPSNPSGGLPTTLADNGTPAATQPLAVAPAPSPLAIAPPPAALPSIGEICFSAGDCVDPSAPPIQ